MVLARLIGWVEWSEVVHAGDIGQTNHPSGEESVPSPAT